MHGSLRLLGRGCVGRVRGTQGMEPIPASSHALVNGRLPSGAGPWVIDRYGFTISCTPRATACASGERARLPIWAMQRIRWFGGLRRRVRTRTRFGRRNSTICGASGTSTLPPTRGRTRRTGSGLSSAIPTIRSPGTWHSKGKVADATDRWAIDATRFEQDSRRFMVWSGWEGEVNVAQHLYIAELSDPWTVMGPRVRISSPEFPWETSGI